MSSAIIVIALAAAIIGVAKGLSFWNGKKSERLKNAEQTIKDVAKANDARADSSCDDKLRERYDL